MTETLRDLLSILSIPRPNGSRTLRQTAGEVRAWLEEKGIPVQAHRFVLHPYFMELLGLWMALTGLLLPVAALGRWGWGGLILAVLALAVPLLEVRLLCPTVTALVRQAAENLVVSFASPPSVPPAGRGEVEGGQEVILCAHLDSKTELLDHIQRARLLQLGVPAMGLALVSGALIAGEALLPAGTGAQVVHWLALLTALPVAAYGLGMGTNLIGGRLSRHPSTGTVDNGTAVAILLALARRLHQGEVRLGRTSVTILFTVGEEAQLQGALAYVRDRADWSVPASVFNLEVMGQDGGYVVWEHEGTAMRKLPSDPTLVRRLERAVEAVTGERPVRASLISSDAFAFLRGGIPAATLGSFDLDLGGRGFHSALDNLDRVDPARLVEAVDILSHLLADMDSREAGAHSPLSITKGV